MFGFMADDATGTDSHKEFVKGLNSAQVRTSPAAWLRKPVEAPVNQPVQPANPSALTADDEGLFSASPTIPQSSMTPQVIAHAQMATAERGLFDLPPAPIIDVPAAAQQAANEALLAAERQVQRQPILPASAALAHEAAAAQVAATLAVTNALQQPDAARPELQPIQHKTYDVAPQEMPQQPSSVLAQSTPRLIRQLPDQQVPQQQQQPPPHQQQQQREPLLALQQLASEQPEPIELLVAAQPVVSGQVPVQQVPVQQVPVQQVPVQQVQPVEYVAVRPIPVLTSPRSLSAAARASLPTAADGTVASVKRGWLRRPAGRNVPTPQVEAVVDPSQLPPPTRPGFVIAQPIPLDDGLDQPSRRQRKKLKRTQAQAQQEHQQAATNPSSYSHGQPSYAQQSYATQYSQQSYAQPTAAQILDTRVPGKAQTDIAFIVPLVPAMFVAAGSTYLWFQASARIGDPLIVVPIFIGLMVGGIMRMGTKSLDFARIIFAVILTTFAMLVGYSWVMGHAKGSAISWSDTPPLLNTDPLSTFMNTADRSLGEATVMFFGLIAAAVIASLKSK
jgi:hypothetical protein